MVILLCAIWSFALIGSNVHVHKGNNSYLFIFFTCNILSSFLLQTINRISVVQHIKVVKTLIRTAEALRPIISATRPKIAFSSCFRLYFPCFSIVTEYWWCWLEIANYRVVVCKPAAFNLVPSLFGATEGFSRISSSVLAHQSIHSLSLLLSFSVSQ